ncbi:MAG: magnesium transporter [Alphaproteobacteria bacterium]
MLESENSVQSQLDELTVDKRRLSGDDLSPAELVIDDVSTAIELGDNLSLEAQITALHPADLADLFEFLPRDKRIDLAERVGPLMDSETLTFLEGQVREEVLGTFTPENLGVALGELETDDAVDLIEDFDEDVQREVLTAVPAQDRALIEDALSYPEESAGRLMSQDFVTMPASWSVGQAIDHLRNAKDLPDDFHDIYVVEAGQKPVGVMSVSRVLRSARKTKLSQIMSTDLHTMAPTLDQEETAHEFRQYALVSAPIVDDNERLVGVVTVDDVVHVIDEEAEDDLLKLAGLGSEADFFANARSTAQNRFPWLLLNLATAVLASLVIGLFSDSLEKVVALAILMPIVASMGGNAGTQTLTVAIRGMAMRDLTRATALRFVGKEMLIGSINGIVFAFIVSIIAWIWFGQTTLAVVIAIAMVVNMFVAALGGALIPLILDRFGIDPANASGVFLTTVTDVVGFVAFLGLAAAFIL